VEGPRARHFRSTREELAFNVLQKTGYTTSGEEIAVFGKPGEALEV
jgi:hypothetical protein